MHPADVPRVALFRALATVPPAVELVAETAGPARAGLLAQLEESHLLREFLRELPTGSPALLDQIERALDTVQRRMVETMEAVAPSPATLGAVVSEVLDLDARGQERDALLRDCEAYGGLERRELRLELALAARAIRRGRPRRAKLRVSDAEVAQLRAVVRTLVRELREVEIAAAVPFDELHHSAVAVRGAWSDLARARIGAERSAPEYRGELESLEQFSGRVGATLASVRETEALPPGGTPRAGEVRPQRRVPLLPRASPRQAESPAASSPAEDWRVLLGRKGEWLVVQKQLAGWRELLARVPEQAVRVLSEVVDRYWKVEEDRDVRAEVRRLLEAPGRHWVEDEIFKSLIWPASTGAGDGMGFDVVGLTPDLSTWLCLEVKATEGPPGTPFEMTVNELSCARREGPRYAIARVSRVSTAPAIAYWRNPAQLIEENRLTLMPVRYQVAVRGSGPA